MYSKLMNEKCVCKIKMTERCPTIVTEIQEQTAPPWYMLQDAEYNPNHHHQV